ncbi:hypothetical protein GCM10010371_39130 [Streptomyces subrutilus]|uniref:Uncharacterized protein n=1 Tax=Streptomyces subrutilus TaxID=36818 RepID=A0A918R080_9ACTN|nr:hypothetical protein GCM10010371_39130 [Streptomyces subrutilus]
MDARPVAVAAALASFVRSGSHDRPSDRTTGEFERARVPSSAVAATGLVGGYAVARWTGKRPLGGVVLGAAGLAAGRERHRRGGVRAAAGLGALYLAGFAGAHPPARKVGAWPAVVGAAAVVAAAAWATADRA